MKPVRLLLVIVGVLVALCAVALGLLLVPSVQHWALLRATRDVPGLKLEIASVEGGFSGITLQGVRAEKQQVVVTVDRLEADFSLLKVLFGRQLVIDRLQASGLSVDASHVSRAKAEVAAAGAPAAAPGLLARVELPFDLTLEEVRIEGHARLPGGAGQAPLEADYTVTGGKFSVGQEGLLQFNATLRNPTPEARVVALRAQAGLRATLTPQRTFGKVSLTSLIDAEGGTLSGHSQLKVGAELFRSSTGENYEIAVSTVLQGVAENVLTLHAQLPASGHPYAGDWELRARTAQLEPFFLGGSLPDFAVKGGGRFAFDPRAASANLQGSMQGRINHLETLNPAWRAFGALTLDTTFDVNQQEGVLHLAAFKAMLAGTNPVLEVRTTGPVHYDLRKHQLLPDGATDQPLLQVVLHGLPVDWVRPFITVADVSGGLITGQIDLVRASGTGADASLRGRLQADEINLVQAGRPLLMKASVGFQIEAALVGSAINAPVLNCTVTTPAGDTLELKGRLARPAGPEAPVSLAGRINATSTQLLARWLPGAPLKAQGDFDFTLRGSTLEIRPGRFELQQAAGRPLVNLTLKQPFSLNLSTRTLVPQDATQPVARIELGRLPLGILPVTQPDTVLGGVVTQGDFELTAPAGKMLLRAVAPVQLADVSLTQNRQTQLSGLTVEALPAVEYAGPVGLKVQTGQGVVRNSAKETMLTFKADLVRGAAGQGAQAVMTFTLEVPALAGQPLFAGARGVSAGQASGEIRAATGTHSQLEARMTLNGLIAAETGQTLPVANLSFRGLVQPSGAISIQAPLLLDNAGSRSDLNFALELSPLGRGYSVDGHLTGQHVELEDLLGVLGVFTATVAPDNADRPAAAASVPPDTIAAWSRFSGQLGLDIKSVTRGQDWTMTGLNGSVAIEPARLALSKLEASFSETSRLAATMEMRFTGGAMPYRLTGEYSLNDFDAGRLFKAFDPGKPPTVEGLFNVNATFSGNGETTGRALDRLHGDFQLTSRQGVFRGLQRTSSKVSMATKAVDAVSALGSIFGSDKVKQTAEKVAGQAYFVDQLAQSIGELNYDLLSVRLTRDELLNMNLQDISLVSPEIRLNGRGDVSYVVGKPLLEQPLNAALTFAARGKLEQLLGKLRLLDGTKDELGYARTKDAITVNGTLAKPSTSAFFTKLASGKLADFLDADN